MRFTFVILLFCGLGADAQMIIKAHANYRPYAAAQNLLLDDYPNSAAAYSLRKLRTAYSGNAIRVRRSNDNTEQDIGFTAGGDLDTASLKTFVSANSGFVTTWYDQSTNADNVRNTTAANQPRIVNAGTVERIAGEPSIFFDGSNDRLSVTTTNTLLSKFNGEDKPVSNFAVINKTNTNTIGTIFAFGSNVNQNPLIRGVFTNTATVQFQIRDDAAAGGLISITSTNTYSANTNYIYSVFQSGTNVNFYVNTTDYTPVTNTTNVGALTSTAFSIGTLSRGSLQDFFGGYISENIIYDSSQSSNRTGIITNINSYYGIY
jgi:hypothetical protein